MNSSIAFAVAFGIGVISLIVGFVGGAGFLKVTKKPWTIWPLVIVVGVGVNVLNAALNVVSMNVSSYLAGALCVGLIASSRKANREVSQHSEIRNPAAVVMPARTNGSDVPTSVLSRFWRNTRIRITAILFAVALVLVAGVLVAPAMVRSTYEIQDLIRARDHQLRYRAFAECVDRVNLTYGDPVPAARSAAYERDWAVCQKLNPGPLEP